jgi:hypothetical protein
LLRTLRTDSYDYTLYITVRFSDGLLAATSRLHSHRF